MSVTQHDDADLTPEQYGRRLAKDAPPLTPEQIRAAARILASAPESAVEHDAA